MSAAFVLSRLLLAAVLVLAAVAKLVDRDGSRMALASFGVSGAFARVGSFVLPVVELTIAAGLVFASTALEAAVAALVLLAVFSFGIARALVRGEQVDCHCFGQLSEGPAGVWTLVRNGALAALAAFIVAGPGRGIAGALDGISAIAALFTLVAIGMALQAWFSWQLLRQNGRLLDRVRALEGARDHGAAASPGRLEVGMPAPAFTLPDATGMLRRLEDLLAPGLPLALVFSDPACASCKLLSRELATLQRDSAQALRIALVTRGVVDADAFAPTLVQDEYELARAYGASQVPSAVLVAPDARIASRLAVGDLAIKELLISHALQEVG